VCSHSLVQIQLGAGAEGERGVMGRSSSGGEMFCCGGVASCWVGDGILLVWEGDGWYEIWIEFGIVGLRGRRALEEEEGTSLLLLRQGRAFLLSRRERRPFVHNDFLLAIRYFSFAILLFTLDSKRRGKIFSSSSLYVLPSQLEASTSSIPSFHVALSLKKKHYTSMGIKR